MKLQNSSLLKAFILFIIVLVAGFANAGHALGNPAKMAESFIAAKEIYHVFNTLPKVPSALLEAPRAAMAFTKYPELNQQISNIHGHINQPKIDGLIQGARELDKPWPIPNNQHTLSLAFWENLHEPSGALSQIKTKSMCAEHKYIIVIGHNHEGRIKLADGSSIHIKTLEAIANKNECVLIVLSCTAKKYLPNGIGTSRKVSYAQSVRIAKDVIKYLSNKHEYDCQPSRQDVQKAVYESEILHSNRSTMILLTGVTATSIIVASDTDDHQATPLEAITHAR